MNSVALRFFLKNLSCSRHPTEVERPKFRSIHLCLCDNLEDVLSIPQEALDTHQLAGVLGSPLEAGEKMYEDLKRKYYYNYEQPM